MHLDPRTVRVLCQASTEETVEHLFLGYQFVPKITGIWLVL
jgi:hypothetical protein